MLTTIEAREVTVPLPRHLSAYGGTIVARLTGERFAPLGVRAAAG